MHSRKVANATATPAFRPLSWRDCLQPEWPVPVASRVRAILTTRAGGVSEGVYGAGAATRSDVGLPGTLPVGGLNLGFHTGDDPLRVAANRARLERLIGHRAVWLDQVHGTQVLRAEYSMNTNIDPSDQANRSPSIPPCGDGWITDRPRTACAVMIADCLPVLLCDRAGTAVGVAHAGWRGLVGGVLERCVERLRELTGDEIVGYLGPAIGPSGFEVGAEVREAFLESGRADEVALIDAAFAPRENIRENIRENRANRDTRGIRGNFGDPNKYWADIYQLARIRLERAGVHVTAGGHECTVRDSERFYSYRREGVTGRMAALIWLEDR
jgi:YfiH family protein